MPAPEHNLEALTNRVAKLEAQNHWLKRAGIVSFLLCAAIGATGQATPERTLEAEKFIVRDHNGKIRAQLERGGLDFFDDTGDKSAVYRGGDLALFETGGKTGHVLLTAGELTITTPQSHIDLQTSPLRLYIKDEKNIGYVSLGMQRSLGQDGVIGPGLTLFGNKGQGFAQLDATDGPPRLHLEPGMWDGKLLPSGFVDITSEGPLIQVSDQEGVKAGVGRFELEDKQTGKKVRTGTASIVLAGKDKVFWSAP